MAGHDGKKQKARSAEPSGTEAEVGLKGSESVASKEAKAAEVKKKAADAAKTKAAEAAKTKAIKGAEVTTIEKDAEGKGKALTISKAPRREAKEGHDVAMTQSLAIDEVVNESAPYPAPMGDFDGLHKQLALTHEVSLL
jgi:hypothetical protein